MELLQYLFEWVFATWADIVLGYAFGTLGDELEEALDEPEAHGLLADNVWL